MKKSQYYISLVSKYIDLTEKELSSGELLSQMLYFGMYVFDYIHLLRLSISNEFTL